MIGVTGRHYERKWEGDIDINNNNDKPTNAVYDNNSTDWAKRDNSDPFARTL